MQTIEQNLQDQIAQIVRPKLKFLSEDAILQPDASLGDLGLDSLASIDLLLDLESQLHVEIPDELLDENTFASISHLSATLAPLLPA